MSSDKQGKQKPASSFPAALIGHLPVRQRYFLTRRNGLRLRYFVFPLIAGLFFALGALVGPGTHPADDVAQNVSYAQTSVPTPTRSAALLMPVVPLPTSETVNRVSVPGGGHDAGRTPDSYPGAAVPQPSVVPVAASALSMPKLQEKHIKIGKGDALTVSLQKAGVSAHDTYLAVQAMEDEFDPRHIRPGQELTVRFDPASHNGVYDLSDMRIVLDPLKTLVVYREGQAFETRIEEKDVTTRLYAKKAKIEVSLFGSAAKAGVPDAIIAETIRIFSWDVDFQRDIRQDDEIDVLYEQLETDDGQMVKSGNILYARLNVNGRDIPVYRFEDKNGDVDYYTAEGRSIRKALMKTPVDGARISSGFGMRKHPVLGYGKMHKGLDFAAPTGTPIYAAGDAVVEKAGRNGSFGNYIRLRHNATLKTAYAHLSRIGKGVVPGARVKQGQVIGYVGTTGRSTGPHLHYEVQVNGEQVNPQTHKSPQGKALKGEQLQAFKMQVGELDSRFAALSGDSKVAAWQGNL